MKRVLRRYGSTLLITALLVAQPVNQVPGPGWPAELTDEVGTQIQIRSLTVARSSHPLTVTMASSLDLIPSRNASNEEEQPQVRRDARKAATNLLGYRPARTPKITHLGQGRLHGTSTGLAWALAYLALEDPDWLTGLSITTTGVISGSGTVHDVGGVEHKFLARSIKKDQIILLPSRQATQAREILHRRFAADRPAVVGVDTLTQAVSALCVLAPHGRVCAKLNLNPKRPFSDSNHAGRRILAITSPMDRRACYELGNVVQKLRPAQIWRCEMGYWYDTKRSESNRTHQLLAVKISPR